LKKDKETGKNRRAGNRGSKNGAGLHEKREWRKRGARLEGKTNSGTDPALARGGGRFSHPKGGIDIFTKRKEKVWGAGKKRRTS